MNHIPSPLAQGCSIFSGMSSAAASAATGSASPWRRIVTYLSLMVSPLAGCATSRPAPEKPPVAEETAPLPVREPVERLEVPAVPVEGPAGLERLCAALRDPDRMPLTGDEGEQERHREAQEVRRAEAFETRFVVDVPPNGFDFAAYDADEGVLRLAERGFSLDEAAIVDRPPGEEPIVFRIGAAAAERLLLMHRKGTLTLRLVFQPVPSQMRPDGCLRQSGGRSLKLAAQVLAAYPLGETQVPMARYETDGFAQVMARQQPVSDPEVKVGKPLASGDEPVASDVEKALSDLRQPLLACYTEALARKPTTQGTLVIAMAPGQSARMEMSTLDDEPLVGCALARLSHVSLPRAPALSLPITFGPADK